MIFYRFTLGLVWLSLTLLVVPSYADDNGLNEKINQLRQRVSQLRVDMQQEQLRLQDIINTLQEQVQKQSDESRMLKNRLEQQSQILLNFDQKVKALLGMNIMTISSTLVRLSSTTIEKEKQNPALIGDQPQKSTLTAIHSTNSTSADESSSPTQKSDEQLSRQIVEDRQYYNQGLDSLSRNEYGDAEKSFMDFIKQNPQSILIPDTLYWLGETYFFGGKFAQSLTSYDEVINRFPYSRKYGKALLKSGYVLMELENYEEAKSRFVQIQESYPDSVLYKLATQKLELIGLIEQ